MRQPYSVRSISDADISGPFRAALASQESLQWSLWGLAHNLLRRVRSAVADDNSTGSASTQISRISAHRRSARQAGSAGAALSRGTTPHPQQPGERPTQGGQQQQQRGDNGKPASIMPARNSGDAMIPACLREPGRDFWIDCCTCSLICASKLPMECSAKRATNPSRPSPRQPTARQIPTTRPMRAPMLTSIHAAGRRFW